ncbi:hypothetical protein MUS1_13300 [Marinomonas ushuaiensis DSM 15871]|uniref:Uncharacterized protein n=1 Tax=Marinomonas ushuaiensis DSM 15871 TaxID=1122207 RepID=X7E527_9GAMM|nr:hypothetical protein MUS1_13300 [Marinomonas ushuaiensis DSM 15871]
MKHAVGIMKLIRRAEDELGKQVVVVLHDINLYLVMPIELLR